MRRRTRQPDRAGFTIVELLVAMALIVFIMYVLAEAFSAGAKTFRDLKAIGDMNERLRSATAAIRSALSADHFEGRKRLSDPTFWDEGPPKMGFFRIWQEDGGATEGTDLDGFDSYRTTTHHLHFTARLRGNSPANFFRATVPTGSPLLSLDLPDSRFQDTAATNDVFTSQWAEVAVYLKPTGETTEDPNAPTGSPVPLHALFLRTRLLVPSRDDVDLKGNVAATDASKYLEVSQITDGANLAFNSPADITMPARRFGNTSNSVSGNVDPKTYATLQSETGAPASLAGSDVLLTDVISMDIRVLLDPSAYTGGAPEDFISLHSPHVTKYWMNDKAVLPATPKSLNTEFAATAALQKVRVFDTWSSRKDDKFDYTTWNSPNTAQQIPIYVNEAGYRPIRIRAIKITLRIWDSKTKQSRQVSLVQDM